MRLPLQVLQPAAAFFSGERGLLVSCVNALSSSALSFAVACSAVCPRHLWPGLFFVEKVCLRAVTGLAAPAIAGVAASVSSLLWPPHQLQCVGPAGSHAPLTSLCVEVLCSSPLVCTVAGVYLHTGNTGNLTAVLSAVCCK